MKHNVALKLAASTLALGLTVVGCKPSGYRPASASAATPKAEHGAAKLYAKAQAASQAGNFAEALDLAERTVELAPRDAGYRMLLADLYLKNGRFLSAENAFSDVLTLDPGNVRAGLSRALALIGQGKAAQASLTLNKLAASGSPADVGLAFALAGHADRAIELLEPAARAPGADGRIRQNLALAYALAGDWQKARIVAAQDLSPQEVASRLEQWAALSNPSAPHMRVATLLNVSPVEDAGQPTRLALAPAVDEAPVFVEAQVPAPAPVQQAPVQTAAVEAPVAKAPVPAPVQVASVPAPVQLASIPVPVTAATPVEFDTAPVSVPSSNYSLAAPVALALAEAEDVKVPSVSGRSSKRVSQVKLAAAVQSLVQAPAPVVRASAALAPKPIRSFDLRKLAQRAKPLSTRGKFVVQIGAYRNLAQVEKAWAQAQRRYRFAGGQPLSTTVTIPGKGTFHRLAVSGFETPVDAARLCQSVRSKGGACFVRANAGDAPLRWAVRNAARRG